MKGIQWEELNALPEAQIVSLKANFELKEIGVRTTVTAIQKKEWWWWW